MEKNLVLILSTKANGGIKSIVDLYLESDLKDAYRYVPTHIETEKFIRLNQLIFFIGCFIRSLPYFFSRSCKIVHMHTAKHGSIFRKIVFLFMCKLFNKKAVLHMHGGEFFHLYKNYNPFFKLIMRTALALPDKIVVLSEIRKNEYSEMIDPGKITVIPNFIDLNKIAENFEKKQESVKIVSLGRIGNVKGSYDLVKAVKKIEHLNFKLEWAGDGELEKYSEIIKNMKLTHKIDLLGWITGKKKEDLYRSADIFILPSYFEDLPMSILEAMSYKIPVVSTPVGGIPEMVENNKNGFLVNPGDVDALAEKLEILIKDVEKRKKMGKEGLKVVQERYSRQIIEQKLSTLYDSLL